VAYPILRQNRVVLRYASCAAGCTSPAAWRRADIDSALNIVPTLAADSAGTIHVIYARYDSTPGLLRYARCAAACTTASNWVQTTIDTGLAVAAAPSMALGPDGGMHVIFTTEEQRSRFGAFRRLWYGSCASGCVSGPAWHFVSLDSGYLPSPPSVAVEKNATVLVAYSVSYSDARIATCRTACGNASGWAGDTLAGFGWGPKLAPGPTDTVYLVAGSPLSLASCAGGCNLASNSIRGAFANGVGPNIAVDPWNHPRVAYEWDLTLRMALFR
jgi:hypothetical protein